MGNPWGTTVLGEPGDEAPVVRARSDRGRDRKVRGEVAPVAVVVPPGDFGDGPVYVRVHRGRAGGAWPQPGHEVEVNDRRCSADPVHDYVLAENSHNAFIYTGWIVERGVPMAALSVVRLTDTQR